MAASASRHIWIDLFRGLAVVGMIWTHAANTFLDSALQQTSTYHTLGFYHGLVAPIFFWVAGLMRGMSAARGGIAKPWLPVVKRLLIIWAVGYLLHVPWQALSGGDCSLAVQRVLFQSDVLHCLALSCLLLVAVERALPSLPHRRLAVLALGAASVGLTPVMAATTSGLPWLDAYLGRQHGSLFPLFPWFGFAAAGFLCGSPWAPSWRLAVFAGLAAIGLPALMGNQTTLLFFAERLGWVTLLALIISRLPAGLPALAWLRLAGRESLLVYVAHLLMIHAIPWWQGRTLDHVIGETQSPLGAVVIFAGLLILSLLLAWANEGRKARAEPVQ